MLYPVKWLFVHLFKIDSHSNTVLSIWKKTKGSNTMQLCSMSKDQLGDNEWSYPQSILANFLNLICLFHV